MSATAGKPAQVVVAGGGIGGIAAALGLARQGFAATVLDAGAELGEIGAGIQLGPNAFHAPTGSASAPPRSMARSISTSWC